MSPQLQAAGLSLSASVTECRAFDVNRMIGEAEAMAVHQQFLVDPMLIADQ